MFMALKGKDMESSGWKSHGQRLPGKLEMNKPSTVPPLSYLSDVEETLSRS